MSVNNKKLGGLMGLCARAGKMVSGEFSVEKALKEKKAKLVFIAGDASENTKKKFFNMCEFRNVPYRVLDTKEDLGHVIGREYRAVTACTDPGFAAEMIKQLELEEMEG